MTSGHGMHVFRRKRVRHQSMAPCKAILASKAQVHGQRLRTQRADVMPNATLIVILRHHRRPPGSDPFGALDLCGHQVTAEEAARLLRLHAEAYARQASQIRPLPGARELLAYLTRIGVPWTIATSGRLLRRL